MLELGKVFGAGFECCLFADGQVLEEVGYADGGADGVTGGRLPGER